MLLRKTCGGHAFVTNNRSVVARPARPRRRQPAVYAVFTRQDSGVATQPETTARSPVRESPSIPHGRPPLAPGDIHTTCQAIILAGGYCDNPLARHRAMPAVRFGAMYRLIDVPIGNCVSSGIDKIYVLTQFHSHELNTHITQSYPPRGFGDTQSFVDVLACVQTPDSKHWYRGSAEAVARSFDSVLDPFRGGDRAEDLIILSGQAVYRMDFAAMVNAHRMSGADITLATYCVSKEDAERMGVVHVDPSTHEVTNFTEKPDPAVLSQFAGISTYTTPERPYLASLGIYVFRQQVLQELLGSDASGMPPAHFGHDVIPAAISQGLHVQSYYHTGFWKDVAKLKDYYEANLQLARPNAPLRMGQVDGTVAHRASMPPPRLHNSTLHNTLLGDAVVLMGCDVRDSVLGCGTFIGPGSVVDSAVILGCQVYQGPAARAAQQAAGQPTLGLGANVTVKNAILDLDCSIGDGSTLVNAQGIQESTKLQGMGIIIRDGLVVVNKGAVVPPGTHV